ncbi:hypothetical protein [Succinivibrio dextrinosolvens]|uniref:hypothetical protein n=1 Tax=Succinivibrio dextrinosolvens TaxID=83771 RepID=UPI00241DD203|nr:hypothetical protein [Succinivibrio dextrinosolvens]MBE6422900.1 hypothetical protein [Succinivibrio dextrinosolvens]
MKPLQLNKNQRQDVLVTISKLLKYSHLNVADLKITCTVKGTGHDYDRVIKNLYHSLEDYGDRRITQLNRLEKGISTFFTTNNNISLEVLKSI